MGPVRVVMIDVVNDKIVELAAVPDDGAVKEFASKGADPAFGERVRHGSAHRRLEDLHTFGSEDLVEGVDELAGAVAHERPASASWWPVGAENYVVAGQAAFRYSLMSPLQRAASTTWRCLSGWSGGSVATGGRWSSERWGRCVLRWSM